jgi:EAL domain-containing protein (putative c-di-GMP-specific phosphodiesterase class I)
LKIDRSFVANCDTDRMNAGLCETIIALAHRLGSKAVAEGIETALELKALHRMGCDLGQGYLFARPMPRDHFLRLLRERGKGGKAAS